MPELIVAIVVVLALSGLSSCAEVAIFAVPYGQVLTAWEEDRRGAKALKRVKEQTARPIMAIVIWNNIANIGGSIAIGALAARLFDDQLLGVFSAGLTLLVIVVAEIIPKTLGERYAERLSLSFAGPVLLLSRVLMPLIWMIEQIVRPFARNTPLTTSEKEIKALTRLGKQAGVIEADESELIQRVFRLNDTTAGDIHTPLHRVDAVDGSKTVAEVKEAVMAFTHTRLPVSRDGDPNQIVGVVNVRAVLERLAEDQHDTRVAELAGEAHFVPESMVGDDLLRHFQTTKQHLAIVVNGLGTVLGVVTLEDVLEELVGEIVDETDVERVDIQKISPDAIRVQAFTDIREVNDALGIDLAEPGRIGEMVVEHLGRIPAEGESFELDGLTWVVEDATPRGVRWLRLERLAQRSMSEG